MALLATGCSSEGMFLYCRCLEDIILMMGRLPFYRELVNTCSREDALFLAFYCWIYLKSPLHVYWLTWLKMGGGMFLKILIACKPFGEHLSLALSSSAVLTKIQ